MTSLSFVKTVKLQQEKSRKILSLPKVFKRFSSSVSHLHLAPPDFSRGKWNNYENAMKHSLGLINTVERFSRFFLLRTFVDGDFATWPRREKRWKLWSENYSVRKLVSSGVRHEKKEKWSPTLTIIPCFIRIMKLVTLLRILLDFDLYVNLRVG